MTAVEYVALANEPGRHGYKIVGTFGSVNEADAWLVERKLDGIVKPLVAPEDWRPDSGAFDDKAL